MDELNKYRNEIDEIDKQITEFLKDVWIYLKK